MYTTFKQIIIVLVSVSSLILNMLEYVYVGGSASPSPSAVVVSFERGLVDVREDNAADHLLSTPRRSCAAVDLEGASACLESVRSTPRRRDNESIRSTPRDEQSIRSTPRDEKSIRSTPSR
ncbi:hypothetical protein K435DRAFT_973502 [Dendrothele bispora CBS 962.96]|uniref:Uncharacterized protein n=1 Tax=Dendrothele bispora (strain CBS 962.96) TaxID=1314807 RepID=A0A4S8KSY8_DENBC|nr:hypothetical protein K435DRAFT_973502 [Dendrothele bispora CBS 962.96]